MGVAFKDDAYHVTRDTADLYAELVGEDTGKPIFYLHGGPGYNSFSFRDLVGDSLEQHLMIYADQRGGGRSYAEAPFSLEVLADDVRAILDALKMPRATLLAHGFGATIAVQAAVSFPGLAERLILVNPWFSMPMLARTIQRKAARMSGNDVLAVPPEAELQEGDADDPIELTNQAFQWQPAKRVFDELLFPDASSRMQLEHSDTVALAGPTEFAELENPWLVDVVPLLNQLTVKTVFIAGQHDASSLASQVEAGLLQLPEALFSMTEGGHYPWIDDPETFLSLLEQALAA